MQQLSEEKPICGQQDRGSRASRWLPDRRVGRSPPDGACTGGVQGSLVGEGSSRNGPRANRSGSFVGVSAASAVDKEVHSQMLSTSSR